MPAVGTERKQIFTYDRIIKTRGWKSLLIVNPKGDAEVNGLMNFCRHLRITVIWDPVYHLTPMAPPSEPLRRAAVLARLQVTARANPRLRMLVAAVPVAAAELAKEQHAGQLEPFSGVILAQLDQNTPLAPQLRCWAALCGPEGMLIGKQHADLKLRAELSAISKLWRAWPNSIWLLDTKHLVSAEIPPENSRESPEIPQVEGPMPQECSPDNPPEIRGTISAPGPIKPPVGVTNMEHLRTRPVWETVERNLAS